MSASPLVHIVPEIQDQVPALAGRSQGVPSGPYHTYMRVQFTGPPGSSPQQVAEALAAEIELWEERQRLAKEWGAAAVASSASDVMDDDASADDEDA